MVELKIQGVAGEVEAAPGLREVAEEGDAARAEYEAWFLRKVQEALDEANNGGEFLTHEEVEAESVAWRAKLRRTMTPEQRRMVDEVNLDALRFD